MVSPFGSALHVSGTDRKALEAGDRARSATIRGSWTEVEPNLEDVFIHLMSQAGHNTLDQAA